MPNAVLDTATAAAYVKRWGEADFSVLPEFDGATESQVVVTDTSAFDGVEPPHHYTVVGGVVTLLSPANQAIADAAVESADNAALKGAPSIARVFANAGQLPIPPPISGAFVAIVNGPGGLPGLALSTNTGWVLFAADSSLP